MLRLRRSAFCIGVSQYRFGDRGRLNGAVRISETTIMLVASLVPSVILHEIMHGVVALWFGDDTAKRAGRLTLNPLVHIDPFGTLILPVLLALSSFGVFGYAKPVPVNPSKLRIPRRQSLYVSLAGPATNVALAVLAAMVFRTVQPVGTAGQAVFIFGLVNVLLAVFNMLPIPPLDGSAVIERFLPDRLLPQYHRIRQYSMGVLLAVVLLLPRALNGVFDFAANQWVAALKL